VRSIAGPTVTLGSGFAPVGATITPQSAGNEIGIYVAMMGASGSDAFYIDAITLTR